LRVENIQAVDIDGGYKESIFRRTRLEICNDFPGRFRLGQEALLVRNLAAKTHVPPVWPRLARAGGAQGSIGDYKSKWIGKRYAVSEDLSTSRYQGVPFNLPGKSQLPVCVIGRRLIDSPKPFSD